MEVEIKGGIKFDFIWLCCRDGRYRAFNRELYELGCEGPVLIPPRPPLIPAPGSREKKGRLHERDIGLGDTSALVVKNDPVGRI